MKKNLLILILFFCVKIANSQSLKTTQSKDSTQLKASDKAKQLSGSNNYKQLITFCKIEISKALHKEIKDSLEISFLSYYQYKAQHHFKKYLESLKSLELGLEYYPNKSDYRELKGIIYYKKAYLESRLQFPKRSQKSMKKASLVFSKLEKPNDDYTIGSYNFLSQQAAYNGNLEEAKRYLRLSEKTYLQNKNALDLARTDSDGNYDRYEVILPYKNIYMLYKQGTSKKDSLEILRFMNHLEKLQKEPEFNKKYESVFYTSALNHLGDWYASRKDENLTTKEDLKKAHYYIDKSIDFVENKGFSGNIFTFKYNKCKALMRSNQLFKADKLISELLEPLSEKDGRKPFFLAMKGLIKVKLNQKDTALVLFNKALEKVHSGDSKLKKDLSNFKPNKNFGQTKLILRISEELSKYYKSDVQVQKLVSRLYYMAFLQFENSYDKAKFNKTHNDILRKIIHGILKMKQKGFGINLIQTKDFLNRTETIKNQLEWKRFNQNRFSNNLPQLDSLNFRKLELRSLMAKAKLNANISMQDSVFQLIESNKRQTKLLYPNLDLLSNKYFAVADLQSKLNSNQIIIKYVLLDNEIAVYKITFQEVSVDLKPWTKKEKELVSTFAESVKNQKINYSIAEELAKILIPEMASNIHQITINPDGELYQFPFEILRNKNLFLTQKYSISYTSNLGFIYPKLNRSSNEEELAIYVPDYSGAKRGEVTRDKMSNLKGAKEEAAVISSLFKATVYSGNSLTKQKFFETSKKAKLLHLGMHSKVNNEEPELSSLFFGNSKNEQDNLYLEELYGVSLQADLAVLSACNTGVGKENAGRSIESFQRAFMFAGVPATVASLWEVPDISTSEIMKGFYKHLKAGESKSEALKNAKLDYLKKYKDSKLEEPFYWSGFVLYGDESALNTSNFNGYFLGLIVFAILLLLILLFKYKLIKLK